MFFPDSLGRLAGFPQSLRSWKGRARRRPGAKPRLRPRVDWLEQRIAPATFTIDPVHLTVNGSASTIEGMPVSATVEGGVARFEVAGDLTVGGGDTIVVSAGRPVVMVVDGSLDLEAGATLASTASSLALCAAEMVDVAGSVAASGSLAISGQTVITSGAIHADGAGGGGAIDVTAAQFHNSGDITANSNGGAGGTVQVNFTGSYVETTSGLIAADGNGAAGGSVRIDGGASGHLFTSGRQEARGATGGSVQLNAGQIDVVGGAEDASGSAGAGGRVSIVATGDTVDSGTQSARGVTQGGFIEVSAGGTLSYSGSADAGASAGPAGTLRLDPENLVIGNAPSGVFPEYTLMDPNPMTGGFGATTTTLSNGNVIVATSAPDGTGTADGAVYLFNGQTGVLISELDGSHAGDQAGNGGVTLLSNGNYLISSPAWNGNEGAVTWGSATSGVNGTISSGNSLVGSHANDLVGATDIDFGGGNIEYFSDIDALANGNYVVQSPGWNGGAGAVTWGSGTSGVSGVVLAANSLVGAAATDQVGSRGVKLLSGGSYVVVSPAWSGNKGAVTWGSGSSGVSGTIAPGNSLVGATAGDQVGSGGVTVLTNGSYVVASPSWSSNKGAVTWGSGSSGVSGTVAAGNSLVGLTAGDQVGSGGVTALGNGNYVAVSPVWSSSTGAVTLGSGSSGVSGAVAAGNSLVGSTAGDAVGGGGVTALTNGNYVVVSPSWNGTFGAVTLASGTTGSPGAVSATNSLVGSRSTNAVGSGGVTVLTNGNYVVASPQWASGRGAVTWVNGTTGSPGAVATGNSLIGFLTTDEVGSSGVLALSNGNYVVKSPLASNGLGAVTWASGTGSTSATISSSNSLTGSHFGDAVGLNVEALSNGNYVVADDLWNSDTGSVTWGSGTSGVSGVVNVENSLLGSSAGDLVGGSVTALPDGNYVVSSGDWSGNTGAVTWGSGTAGVDGTITKNNSLIGPSTNYELGDVTVLSNGNYVVSRANLGLGGGVTWASGSTGVTGVFPTSTGLVSASASDEVGSGGVTLLSNGNYLVNSPDWGGLGAVTWVNGATGATFDGSTQVSAQNSLVGTSPFLNMGDAVADPALGGFVVPFVPQTGVTSGGSVELGVLNANALTFGVAPDQTVTVPPAFLTAALDTGTAVVLQASNDITVNLPIVASAGGHSGALTLDAGRSLLLNASITTDSGNLTLIANDTAANGVVAADRMPGAAAITVGSGAALNAGTGVLTIDMAGGTGITTTAPGGISLGSVIAGSVVSSTNVGLTSAGANPSAVGQPVSVTVSVTASYSPAGSAAPGGNVTIEDASNTNAVVATGTLSGGSATVSVAGLPVGTHDLVAVYGGSSTFLAGQSAPAIQTVDYATTTTLVSNGPNPSPAGEPASFTVNVTPSGGSAVSGESVAIEDDSNGNAVITMATLQNGSATFSVSNLATGSHKLVAIYAGDATRLPSQSSAVTQSVDGVRTAPMNQAVNPGQTATFTAMSLLPNEPVLWEVSTDGGLNFQPLTRSGPYSDPTQDTLTITAPATALSGNEYQAFFNPGSSQPLGSGPATLMVDGVTTEPVSQNFGPTVQFTAASLSNNPAGADTVQWEASSDGGMTYQPLQNGGVYSGVGTSTLTISGPTIDLAQKKYEAVFTNASGTFPSSSALILAPTLYNRDTGPSAGTVAENAPSGTPVGINVATLLNGGSGITYSLTSTAGGRFAIDPNSGAVAVASGGALLNALVSPKYPITVQASDAAGQTVAAGFTITVTNQGPGVPTDADPTPDSVAEHAANGTPVGITAVAADLNPVTYQLTNDAGGRFAIDPNSGVVTVANGTLLVYSTAASYAITVQAADSAGASASATFTVNITSTAANTLVIDGISVINAVINGANVSGTANLPLVGPEPLSGTLQNGQYHLTTPALGNATIDGVALSNAVFTLTNTSLGLAGTATLPLLGTVSLAGTIAGPTDFTLGITSTLPSLGGLTLTAAAIIPSAGGVGFQANASLAPVLSGVALAGTIQGNGHYSFTAAAPGTYMVDGFGVTGASVTLSGTTLTDGSVSLAGTAMLPVFGAVSLNGMEQGGTFTLSTSPATLTIGGNALTGAVITLSASGVSVSGSITLPIVGTVTLAGTIQDNTHYSLTASLPNFALGGFALTNAVATLDPSGLSFSANATLPLVNTVHLNGIIQDASDYSLSVALGTFSGLAYPLSGAVVTLTSAGIGLTGTAASLPLAGTNVMLTGLILDAHHYSVSAPLPSVSIAGFTLSGARAILSDAGLSLSGNATLPVIGTVMNLQGAIQDATHFTLSAPVPTVKVGSFSLSSDTVTLSASGGAAALTLMGNTSSLPVFGVVRFTGGIAADGTLSLAASLPTFSLANGLATITNDTLTLSLDQIHIEADLNIANVANAHFSGNMDASGNYELDASASLTIAGFTIPIPNTGSPDLKLVNGVLDIGFDYEIPGLSEFLSADPGGDDGVTFSGTYSLTGGWSLTAFATFTFAIGPVVVTQESLTLTNQSLMLDAQGSILDLGPLAHGEVGMTIYKDATFAAMVNVNSSIAGFSLGTANVTFGDHNPTKTLITTLQGMTTVPTGPTIILNGYWDSNNKYDFQGKGSYTLGPFALANAQFDFSDMAGPASFTFKAGVNLFSVLQASISGTIAETAGGGFRVTSNLTGTILGGPTIDFVGSFDSQGNYNFTGQQSLNVGPLTLNQATYTLGNTAGPNNTAGLVYSDMWYYGVYTATVSGSFAAEGKGYVVTADAVGTIFGQPLELKGSVHSNGTYDLTGMANVNLGPLTLTKAAFELSNTKGFMFTDNWNYLAFMGNVSVIIDSTSQGYLLDVNGALSLFGTTVTLMGDIDSAGNYSLTGGTSVNVGPLNLAQANFTLNNKGFTLNGGWNYLVFAGNVSATIGSDGQGYVISVLPTSYLSVIGQQLFLSGSIHASGTFSLMGSTNLHAGPLNLLSANFTLNNSGLNLTAGWNYLVFAGNVSATIGSDSNGFVINVLPATSLSVLGQQLFLSGAIHASGAFSLMGSTSLHAGPLNLATANFTLNNSGFAFTAGWNFLVFTGNVAASFGSNGQAYVIDVSNASLSIFGQTVVLSGDISQNGTFDLHGTGTIAVAGITLTSVHFDVNNGKASVLSFGATWNYVFFTGNVGGSIDGNGTVQFMTTTGTGTGTASLAGFGLNVSASAVLDTKDSKYSFTLSSTLDVKVATVSFIAQANWSSGGPQTSFMGMANIGGILSKIVSGGAMFTIKPGAAAVIFTGNLSIPGIPGANLNVNATIDGAGDLTGIPGFPSLGTLGSLIAQGGAALGHAAAETWNTLDPIKTDVAQGLNQLLPNDPADVVGSLQSVIPSASQVQSIIGSAFPSQVSSFLGSGGGEVGKVGGGVVKTIRSIGGETEGGVVFLDPPPFTGVLVDSDPQGFTQPTGGFTLNVPTSFDTNNNHQLDDSEGRIIVQGGVDLATGLPEPTAFAAPGSWSVVSVFSTIVASLYYGQNVADATASSKVLAALGLSPQVNLSNYDPTGATLQGDSNGPAVFTAQAKLEDTIALVSALFRSPANQPASTSLTNVVAGDLATQIESATGVLNFSSSATINALIQAVEASTSSTLAAGLVSGAANVIAAANQQLDALTPAASLTFVRGVSSAQIVAQGSVANDLASAAAGQNAISTVVANDTGSALAAQVAAAKPLPTILVPLSITVPATSTSGAAVNFQVSAYDFAGETLTPTTSAVSGATFPIGMTTVTSSATDTLGDAASTTFTVNVVDSTPPTITLPANIVVEATSSGGASVTLPQATATDPVDPKPTVTENPSSGLFPVGTTSVVVTATDAAGNSSTGSFTVTVQDTTPPTLTLPANLVVEANTSGGAQVTLPEATAADLADPNPVVTEDQSSGFFPLGSTTVHVTATDASGNSSAGTFTVTVQDTTPPAIAAPADLVVEANTTGGAQVTLPQATATDVADPNPKVSEDRSSGFFPLGATTVHITATDASGNTSTATFIVTVQDTTPPTLALPANLVVEATTTGGAQVTLPRVTATDAADAHPQVAEGQSSGFFPLGVTIVHVVATDASGNTSTGTYTVTVQDTTPPVLTLPANLVVEANTQRGARVTLPQATATDLADPNPNVSEDQSSGFFPLGVTTVNVTATDASGNSSTGTFTVTVKDTTPPVLDVPPTLFVQATQPGGGAQVTLPQATAADVADPNPVITYSLASGLFPAGSTTVNVTATDASGNVATGSFTVDVVNVIPPVLSVPANVVVHATTPTGAMVTLPQATATGLVSAVVSESPPSGFFPVGTTLVTVTATDTSGNTSLGTFTVTVNPAVPTITLTDAGPSPSTYGQAVTFVVALASSVGAVIPDGETVNLEDAGNGNAVVATGTLLNNMATIVVTNLSAGTHSLFAAYSGDASNGPGQSIAVSQTVAKRALLLEAVTNTKGYDATTSAAALPVVVGLQGTDTISGLTETYADAAIGTGKVLTPAGTINDGNGGNNYTVTDVSNNTGVITPALIVTPAAGQSVVYGSVVPALKGSFSGFLNGDTAAIVSGSLGTTATAISPAGSYPFTLGGLFVDGDYTLELAASAPVFTVTKAIPVVALNPPAAIAFGTALASGQLSGTATWTVNGSVVNVPGTFAYTSAAGTVPSAGNGQAQAVTFTPTDTTDYTTVTTMVTINVNPATPSVSVNPVQPLTYGTALASGQLTGTATATVNGSVISVPGTFSYSSAAGTVPRAGSGQTEAVTFTPTDATDYNAVTASATINVNPATPIVRVNPVQIPYGTALVNGQLTGAATATVNGSGASVPGTFTYTTAAGSVPDAGSGLAEAVTFMPADPADYSYTSASTTVTVNVTLPPPVTVMSVQLVTEKVHKKSIKVLELTFSGALNAGDAGNLAAYSLVSQTANKKHGTVSKPIPLVSASYAAATNTVTLTPRGTLPKLTMQLTVNAALIKDANGQALAGSRSGQPGTNFVATLNSHGVISTTAVPAPAHVDAVSARAFDALMAAGDVAIARHWHQGPRTRAHESAR